MNSKNAFRTSVWMFFTSPKFLFFLLLFANVSIYADALKLNIGYWSGKHNSEWEKRMKWDDLIDGSPDGMNRYDFRFQGGNSSLFPLGFYYYKDYSNWTLVTRFNYFHRNIGYSFNGLDTNFNASNVRLQNAYSSDYELDFGYKRGFLQNKLFATGRFGFRNHLKNFVQNETIYGGNTLMTTWKGEMNSYSLHPYLGFDLQYIINKTLSLLLDVQAPLPVLDNSAPFGDMRYKLQRVGNFNGRTYIELNSAKSLYSYQLTRASIGVEISLTEKWKIQVGFRQEQIQVKYSNYRNNPWIIADGGTGTNFSAEPSLRYALIENFLDKQNYQRSISSSQNGVYVSTSYQFDFGKSSSPLPSKKTPTKKTKR